jgi:hypothetical protein
MFDVKELTYNLLIVVSHECAKRTPIEKTQRRTEGSKPTYQNTNQALPRKCHVRKRPLIRRFFEAIQERLVARDVFLRRGGESF